MKRAFGKEEDNEKVSWSDTLLILPFPRNFNFWLWTPINLLNISLLSVL